MEEKRVLVPVVGHPWQQVRTAVRQAAKWEGKKGLEDRSEFLKLGMSSDSCKPSSLAQNKKQPKRQDKATKFEPSQIIWEREAKDLLHRQFIIREREEEEKKGEARM